MKLFIIGDFVSNTGPAIVNKNIKKNIKQAYYSKEISKKRRIMEMVKVIPNVDTILLCDYSKANILAILIAKLFKKKIFYLMHGFIKYENQLNGNEKRINDIIEKYIMKNVTKVYCVSKKTMLHMKSVYPEIEKQFDYAYNGIDFTKILYEKNKYKCNNKQNNVIISTGGSLPLKCNINVCKAIRELNGKGNNLKYVIVGKMESGFKEEIKEFEFVECVGEIEYSKSIEKMCESRIYIQNSKFETFGLAVMESLICGCDLLISKNIGCIDLIKSIEDDDIINDVDSIDEIAKKIENLIKKSNNLKLMNSINQQENDVSRRGKELFDKIYDEWRKDEFK